MVRAGSLWTWAGWVLVAAVAAALAWIRFAAVSDPRIDLEAFFLPAAREIVAGGSPYDVSGYFYPPTIALLLAPLTDAPAVGAVWTATNILAGIAAAAVAAFAFVPRHSGIRRPLVAGVAVVTLLYSWPTTLELWLGQPNLLVLLALVLAAWAGRRGSAFLSGLGIGGAALIKAWPALFAVWLLRRGAPRPLRGWLGLVVAGATAVLLALVVAGPQGVGDMLSSPLRGSDQPLAAGSVWGLPRLMFDETGVGDPLVVSPALRWTLALVLASAVLALLALTLLRPGDPALSLFNVVFCVILLLPVSHYVYLLLPLPALWWWVARVAESPRTWAWAPLAVLGVWWLLTFRISPAGDGFATTTWPSLLLIVLTTLAATAASVIGAAALPESEPGRSRLSGVSARREGMR